MKATHVADPPPLSDADGTTAGLAATSKAPAGVTGGDGARVDDVVEVVETTVVDRSPRTSVVVVDRVKGVENGSSSMVVTVAGRETTVGPVVMSGAVGKGSWGSTRGNGVVVDVVDVDDVDVVVVDVVVTVAVVEVVTTGSVVAVEVVFWARPDRAGASSQPARTSTAKPRHHAAVAFMTAPAYRRPPSFDVRFSR